MDSAVQRKNMVDSQVRPSDVTERRLIRAMLEVPREARADDELIGDLGAVGWVLHEDFALLKRIPLKVFHDFGRFDGNAHGQIFRGVVLIPVTLVHELVNNLAQLGHCHRFVHHRFVRHVSSHYDCSGNCVLAIWAALIFGVCFRTTRGEAASLVVQ